MLIAAVKALGGRPDPRELELVRAALLAGPADLVADLELAIAGGSEEAHEKWVELAAVVAAGGASRFTFLDLCTTHNPRRIRPAAQ
jgi:hypothetical protein